MKKIWIIFTIGIAVRLLIAFSTFHPDIQTFNLAGQVIAAGNILNFYDYLSAISDTDPVKHIAVFNYPPLIYYFFGLFNFIFANLLGLNAINQFILDNLANYGNLLFNLHLFLLKIPYLIVDLLVGWIFLQLFAQKKEKLLALGLWMFNPVNLYATYMMGQFDIIPTFFTVLAIYLAVKNKLSWAALALGFGIAFKIYPIFLLVPLILLGRGYRERIKLIMISLLPYIISILPYISSIGFRTNALFASQSSKSLYANIPISGGESLILFPLILGFIYLLMLKEKIHKEDIWKNFLIILLLFYVLTHFHPQWLIWVTPFLIIELVNKRFENIFPVLTILFSWIGSLFFFDPSLTIGLFSPVWPFLKTLPGIWELMQIQIDYNISRSFIQTIFAASAIYLIYRYLPKRANDPE